MPNSTVANTIPIPSEIQSYLESLLTDAGIDLGDEKSKKELVDYLFQRLDRYLAVKIFENLSEEDGKAFMDMTNSGKSQEEIQSFIKTHMKNPDDVFSHAFVDFRDFYLTGQSQIKPSGKN